jgi:diketogulonate reductase-like aldo/keto reductase
MPPGIHVANVPIDADRDHAEPSVFRRVKPFPCSDKGTWHVGKNPSRRAEEIAALRLGIELGMSLIDTAEMYANGHARLRRG